MWKAVAHRPVQACMIAALSALVTACAVFTPLYQRALDQASVHVELGRAPAGTDLLQVTSSGVLATTLSGPGADIPALGTEELTQLVPGSLRAALRRPVVGQLVQLTTRSDAATPTAGALAWRDDACAHLTLTSGRCPSGAGEVAVSTADAANFDWSVGTRLPAIEKQPEETLGRPASMTLTVTGVYAAPRGRYWDGWNVTGMSGTSPDRDEVLHDTWIADRATFETAPTWRNPSSQVDLAVDHARTRLDELLRTGAAIETFRRDLGRRPPYGAVVTARSEIPAIAERVRDAQDQSRVTLPALMVPLGLLGLVVLWMALGAAVEQRRPEVAVARLRGRGVRGAQAHLLRELVPVVLAGVPVGFLAALGLSWSVRHLWLPGDVPVELRWPVWAAVLLAVVAVVATAVLVTAGISREPIVALLRRVPARRRGWSLGTMDAVVVTVAASTLAAFMTGRLTGPVALAAPAVLAFAGGLVLARFLVPVATGAGRRLLAHGRTALAVALLQLARRPGGRATIALLTVASAILVFAVDAVAVGARNRELAAAQQVGAPMVLTVSGGTLASVREAIASTGRSAPDLTSVVVQRPLSDADQTLLYVDPPAFRRIATFPDGTTAEGAFAHLTRPSVAPVELTGTRLSLRVSTESFYEGADRPVELQAQLLRHDGVPARVRLGVLPPGSAPPYLVRAPIDCAGGCTLTGWTLSTDPANAGSGRVTVSGVHTDTGPVDLGTRADWATTDAEGVRFQALAADARSLSLFVDNPGASEVPILHRWVPTTLPAVVSGALPEDHRGRAFAGAGLDGVRRSMTSVARLPWLPATGRHAAVVDLDLAARTGAVLEDNAEPQIWSGDGSRRLETLLTTALRDRGVSVTDVARVSAARAALGDSAAAWSLQLGVLVGVACLVVAALGLVIAGAASWRPRARDLAILSLNGLPSRDVRRAAVVEQLPAIAAAVLTGGLLGVAAAHYALPTLPLLPVDPPVDLVDLSAAWLPVSALTILAALVLAVVGGLVSAAVRHRATLDRVAGAS